MVAERTADLALGQSLADLGTRAAPHARAPAPGRWDSRFRAKGHEIYTTATLLEAEARLLEAGRENRRTGRHDRHVAAVTAANLPGRDHPLILDQALAVEQIATSGRCLDVLVGPAGTGKSTTMAGLRAVWEAEHGAGSVLGPGPLGRRGRGAGRRARHRHREHGQVAPRAPPGGRAAGRIERLRAERSTVGRSSERRARRSRTAHRRWPGHEVARWRLRSGPAR